MPTPGTKKMGDTKSSLAPPRSGRSSVSNENNVLLDPEVLTDYPTQALVLTVLVSGRHFFILYSEHLGNKWPYFRTILISRCKYFLEWHQFGTSIISQVSLYDILMCYNLKILTRRAVKSPAV
jgi:hypothetical protein